MIDLHVHTKYSLLDSINEPKDIVKKALEDGKTAVCVTDHGNIMASIETYKLCKENNLKFIYGCEFYICNNVEVNDKNNRYNHLIVLAKNEQGRVNINKLVSLSTQYKYYGKPRIDWNMLVKYKEGLVVLSACLAGVISRILTGKRSQEQLLDIDIDGINRKLNKKEMAMIVAQRYKDEFGEDFYIEIQAHDVNEQKEINIQLVELAKQLDIQYVVTTDAHYLTREDQKYHSVWVQIGTTREAGEIYNDCYIMTELEVKNKLSKYLSDVEIHNAINNTEIIANKCNVEIPLRDPQLPHIEIPKRFKNENEYVKYMCAKGWIEKGIVNKNKEEQIVYKDRLNYELNALDTMGFLGYFIIVRDYKSTAKKVGISRGCFTGDALVTTKDGFKELKDIKVGDYVATADGQFNRVNKTHRYNIKEDLIQFKTCLSEKQLVCTKDHKIAVLFKKNGINSLKWIEARDLKIGDICYNPVNKTFATVDCFNILKNKKTDVYDLTINNFSNYVLNNILVHNSAGGSLVSYLMDITDLDPIPYGLSFERFIDVGAVKLLEKGIITKKELKIPD